MSRQKFWQKENPPKKTEDVLTTYDHGGMEGGGRKQRTPDGSANRTLIKRSVPEKNHRTILGPENRTHTDLSKKTKERKRIAVLREAK